MRKYDNLWSNFCCVAEPIIDNRRAWDSTRPQAEVGYVNSQKKRPSEVARDTAKRNRLRIESLIPVRLKTDRQILEYQIELAAKINRFRHRSIVIIKERHELRGPTKAKLAAVRRHFS